MSDWFELSLMCGGGVENKNMLSKYGALSFAGENYGLMENLEGLGWYYYFLLYDDKRNMEMIQVLQKSVG